MTNYTGGKIAILGAGSIGCYLGGCLLGAGIPALLIGRERIKAQILVHGLTLSDWKNRYHHIATEQVPYFTEMKNIYEADYILLTVKSGDTGTSAREISRYAKPSAVIISLQNGTQNAHLLHNLLPTHTIVKGMVPFNVLYDNKGGFHCGTEGNLAIEANAGQYSDLLAAFAEANLPVAVYQDLSPIQWGKLIMNLNNAVNALSGLPLLTQLNDRTYRNIMTQVIKEALLVLKKARIKPARTGKVVPNIMPHILSLPNWLFKKVASATLKIDPKARSSMFEDFSLGRKTEIDYLNGEIVNLGKLNNMATPVNQAIVTLVKQAERLSKGSPCLSAEEIQLAIVESQNTGK